MSNRFLKGSLLATTVIASMAFAAPAFAQDATNQPVCPPGTTPGTPECQVSGAEETTTAPDPGAPGPMTPVVAENEGADPEVIVVTGTLLRRTNAETPSPVTVISSETLAQRGLTTVAEAVQRVSANNAGTIQSGWNVGFNFASGANAPALRGLTVQSTLSIFDGLRMAPYPLADDGQRNFVDINTIPNAVIDRIEVLRDGASSTYGADAIAGVINIITKREIQGLHINGSAGVSSRGDGGERRLDITFGHGDLSEQGFNFYISGEYQKQNELFSRDRGFPFNTADLSSICGEASGVNPEFPAGTEVCMDNLNWNAVNPTFFFGPISIPGVTLVRPGSTTNPLSGTGQFQFLDPAGGCGGFPEVNVPPELQGVSPATNCVVDFRKHFFMLHPDITRKGLSTRFTFNVGDNHQIYAMGNYYNTVTLASFTPLGFNGIPTPPRGADVVTYNVLLPVYVCPEGVGTLTGLDTGCDATNGVLNPDNPFAAQGRTAQAFFRSNRGRETNTDARALRGVIGAAGTFLTDWSYTADFVASAVRLDREQKGNFIPRRIMDVVARGEFNFTNPELTPESVWDRIDPGVEVRSTSNLWQAAGTISRTLFELAGGPLQAAVGATYRKESIDAPSANPAVDPISGDPYSRFYGVNAVGTQGSRNVKSAFFEVGAPFLDSLEVQLSGRYDKYSTGQKAFSPKIGVKFTPVRELALRATASKGFRAPSFNESFGLPTTGYVTRTVNCTTFQAFCAAHNFNAYATTSFPLGLTQTGNPNLDPERSVNLTAGAIFEPIRNVSFTVDFWNIKVKNLIVPVTDIGPIFNAYYANNGVVNIPGINAVPGAPDPAFPNALPHLGFIESSYRNSDSQMVRGIDFAANWRVPLGGMTLHSSFDASYLMKYVLSPEEGDDLRFDGTLSPCNVTSCSGAPKWRASWQNTLDFGRATLSATAYYTSGLDLASIDFGGIRGDCMFNAENHVSVVPFEDHVTPVLCRAKSTWNVDAVGSYEVNDRLTVYANVLNLFDIKPPFDPSAAYGLYNFNPAWAGPNIMGRFFRFGAKVGF